jgi:hypothetical protein
VKVPSKLLGPQLPATAGEGHVESWFFQASDPAARRGLWMKWTIFARAAAFVPPVASLWAIAFDRDRGHVATKTTVPLAGARATAGLLDVEVDGGTLGAERTRGAVETGRRRIAWDLAIGPALASPILHLPSRALYGGAGPFPSKLLTPLSSARSVGEVRVRRGAEAMDEEHWVIDGWPCMIGHNWGRRHADLYAWAHVGAWENAEDLVFEAVSARTRMGPMLSPIATAAFVRVRGRSFDLNTPISLVQSRGLFSQRRWEIDARRRDVRVIAELAAETDDLVGLHYDNPDGTLTYCLGTKLARAHLELHLPGGEKLTATSRSAGFEIGTHEADHGVRMYV